MPSNRSEKSWDLAHHENLLKIMFIVFFLTEFPIKIKFSILACIDFS